MAPFIAGEVPPFRLNPVLRGLSSPAFLSHRPLRWPLPPSTSLEDPAFNTRRYWKGPTWPVMNWLFWWALDRAGEHERGGRLRQAALTRLAMVQFAEYVEPFTGESLGSLDQSWTVALALDWIALAA